MRRQRLLAACLALALVSCPARKERSKVSLGSQPSALRQGSGVAGTRGVPTHDAANTQASPPAPPTTPARAAPAPTSKAALNRPRPEPAVETDWCTDDVSALDAETCYVLPEPPSSAHELLVYLPGVVPPTPTSPHKTNVERIVARASRRARIAALIPRGLQGLTGKRHPRWWGWPTSEFAYRRHAAELISRICASRRKLEALAAEPFQRVYLAGSSAGGYFAALIALHGGMRADGFGAMSGGSGHVTEEFDALEPVPFYIGFGKQDSVAPASRALAELLRARGWPVRVAAHPVGHGAKEIYLDEAFAFWRSSSKSRGAPSRGTSSPESGTSADLRPTSIP